MSTLKKSALDVVQCEQEPIERPQAVQAACGLLLFDRETGRLAMGSDNLEPVFGQPLSEMLGSKPDVFFEAVDAAALTDILTGESRPVSRYLRLKGGREHFVRLFETGGYIGVELNVWEDAQDQPAEIGHEVGNALQAIEAKASRITIASDAEISELAQFVADEFRRFSGYDRTMVYRFDADWNGEIIAESRSEAAPGSFLGLSFPSSDIPAQARRLFALNRVRPVIDTTSGSAPILPALDPRTDDALDLSDCSIRAVSPVHVEYLANMGVQATLNVALMARGRFWGLLSNHHYSAPYRLTPSSAATCRLLAEIFTTELTRILEARENQGAQHVRECLRSLRKCLLEEKPDGNLGSLLADRESSLLDALACDGAAIFIRDETYGFGTVPEPSTLREIAERVKTQMNAQGEDHFSSHFATGLWPDLAEEARETAAGVFACRFPSEDCDLILFRKPRETEITWGGDPYKRIQPGDGERLHPRKSFEKFVENVKDRSLPWAPETAAKARECVIGLCELDWLLAWRKSEIELADTRAEVAHAANHDALTNLPNRRQMMERLGETVTYEGRWSAVLHVDLDGFKQVNDRLGHAAGDAVLMEVANRLRSQTRSKDFCARVGGDEFVVLCADDLSERGVVTLAERLVAVMAQPIRYGKEICQIGASVGIAFAGDAALTGEALLNQADIALYESKRAGRGRVTVFDAELEQRIRRTQKLGEDILAGVRGGQFVPWYQPQVDAQTLEICGVEALMRWDHPTLGILTPDKFLAIAADTGHIGTLDAISMERALADYRYWKLQGVDVPRVSLNVSYDRLSSSDLLKSIESTKLPTEVFSFELLETIDLDETPEAIAWNLDLLRDKGINLEIDDFGTGKTSIVSLVRLRPDRLKIDRQLVQPIVHSPQSRKLIASIVEIGTSLGIGITAEGVETMEHAYLLRDMGVTVLQGYAFARPMPSDDLVAFIRDRSQKTA